MAENNWTLNDSYPLPMGQEFTAPPQPWPQAWWGPPLAMFMTTSDNGVGNGNGLPFHKLIVTNSFFGPKGEP